MMNPAWIWTAIAALAALSIFKAFLEKKGKRLPPGPRGVPILGHFHLVGKNPHQDLQKLAKTYGPIMHLRFGFVDNIVASTPEAAKQFLKTHDLNFATRPLSEAAKYISNGQKGLSFGQYGPYWRNVRKLCTLEFLSNLKINSYQSMRREELCLLVESFKQAAQNGEAVDLSVKVSSLSANMSCRMVFGKKYEDKDLDEKGFKAVIQEAVKITALPNLGDYFPLLGKLDVQGLTRRMKTVGQLFDEFLEKIINEHEQATSKGNTETTKDFVDTILEIMRSGESPVQFTREHVKSVMLDMLIASMDTSSSVIEWTMSELFRHPEIMEKVKEEIESHVGLDRMVEEKDLEHFKYLEIVIKESLRMHPVVPLLLPHAAREDCNVDGFHIPKNATVTVNVWAIGRDPNVWSDPEKFIPERFNKSSVEYRGQDFELLPFGSGRRSCSGMQLGITVIRLVVAQLIHYFDWSFPDGMLPKDLNIIGESSLVISRAKHLMAIPAYRLCI
ncbi:PREDICTED: cytochrome P450 CYP736A12-like isoform X2 [Ipomoea nil]|uniref:cytochrome P450 CYP736A12-like isoform X2 n=1 Tax=Ipomoea nil TaxID=35883 RepID=UPI000900AE34|nr:PREDICTED: cytochrome P450 CYP736A12-like isoform X2 [Ipomoea nil]